jgi:hypothetical protein
MAMAVRVAFSHSWWPCELLSCVPRRYDDLHLQLRVRYRFYALRIAARLFEPTVLHALGLARALTFVWSPYNNFVELHVVSDGTASSFPIPK